MLLKWMARVACCCLLTQGLAATPPQSYLEMLDKAKDARTEPSSPAPYNCVERHGDNIPDGLAVVWLRLHGSGQPPRERALAFLWQDGRGLHVCAVMEDSDPLCFASGRHSYPIGKGDAMELFFQPDGGKYYELHLAPNLATMEMASPDADTFSHPKPGEKLDFNYDSGMRGKAGKFALPSGTSGWWGRMTIPWERLGTSPGKLGSARMMVCRYNHNTAWGKEPEVSCSAAQWEGTFHQPAKWRRLASPNNK